MHTICKLALDSCSSADAHRVLWVRTDAVLVPSRLYLQHASEVQQVAHLVTERAYSSITIDLQLVFWGAVRQQKPIVHLQVSHNTQQDKKSG